MLRKLNALNVALGLVALHYGVGFLLGTGEAVYSRGVGGALYGVSTAVGMLGLIFITSFYWRKREPLWTLLGRQYGKGVEEIVRVLSWVWMIGVVASQVLGGAFILSTFGLPPFVGICILSVIVNTGALVNLSYLSRFFLLSIIVSSFSMIFIIFKFFGFGFYLSNFYSFSASLPQMLSADSLGIFLSTVLITILGMDFHQFVVAGNSTKESIKGEVIACCVLFLLAFLPTTLVMSGSGVLGGLADGKEALPKVLMMYGNSIYSGLGVMFVAALAFGVLGSGIGVSRVVIRATSTSGFLGKRFRDQKIVAFIGIFIVGALALVGKSILGLIVSFYAVYVASVVVAFIAYLLQEHKLARFTASQIYHSLFFGAMMAGTIVFVNYFSLGNVSIPNVELVTIVFGGTASLVGLVLPGLYRKIIQTWGYLW